VYSSYYSKSGEKGSSTKPASSVDKKRKPEAMSSSSKKLKAQLEQANFNKTRNAAMQNNRSHVEVEYEVEDEYENEVVPKEVERSNSGHSSKKSRKVTQSVDF
jgi:hypothetical protein